MYKSEKREYLKNKKRHGMRGHGVGADRRPESVRTDAGLPKRLVNIMESK